MCVGNNMETIVRAFLRERNAEHLCTDVLELLTHHYTIRWEIFKSMERQFHKEDAESVLKELEIDDYSEDELERIVNRYERYTTFDDDWSETMKQAVWDELEEE